MVHVRQFREWPNARGTCLALAVWVVSAGGASCGEEFAAGRRALDESYRGKLEVLADACASSGLTNPAHVIRTWYIRRDPGRQYIFLPAAGDPTKPATPAEWHERFTSIRREQAADLFRLAQQSLDDHQSTRSYQLLHEVLHEDPDHKEARRVLGLGKAKPTPSEQTARLAHPLFDWPARRHWQVSTQHFDIGTDAGTRAGVELGERLEELYETWQQLFFGYWATEDALARWYASGRPVQRTAKKHKVVLFRDRDEYLRMLEKHAPGHAVSEGIYLYDRDVAWFYAGDESAMRMWRHEATHQLFQETVRAARNIGADDNFWIIEGIALYMESLVPRGGYCTVGGFDALRLQFGRYWVNNQAFYVPLAELTGWGRDDLQQHPNMDTMYSQAASLTHFLMDYDTGRYRDDAIEYLRWIYAGRQRRDSLVELTGTSYNQLDAQYRDYLRVTDADLAERLNPPEHVTMLSLGRTDVTDEGVKVLANYKQLEWLDLTSTKTTDAGLAHLAGLTNLKELWLSGTAITDAGLEHLRGLKNLERLELGGTRTTAEGRAKLKRSLPALAE